MKVREAMSQGTESVLKTDSVKSAVFKMTLHNLSSVTVVDEDHNLIGIVTVRDVMLPLYPGQGEYVHDSIHARDFEAMEDGYGKVMEMTVGDIMTANPVSVSADDAVLKAASFMGLKRLRRIPVTEGSKLVGVITIEHINNALFIANA